MATFAYVCNILPWLIYCAFWKIPVSIEIISFFTVIAHSAPQSGGVVPGHCCVWNEHRFATIYFWNREKQAKKTLKWKQARHIKTLQIEGWTVPASYNSLFLLLKKFLEVRPVHRSPGFCGSRLCSEVGHLSYKMIHKIKQYQD